MGEKTLDWDRIAQDLASPFPAERIEFRACDQPMQDQKDGSWNVQVAAYIDARDVMDRLDQAVGPENWTFDWEPVATKTERLTVVEPPAKTDGQAAAKPAKAKTRRVNGNEYLPVEIIEQTIGAAKGTITIHGVPKSDVGDPSFAEPNKSTVSDTLKRTAVLWGIGRYLYHLPRMHAPCNKYGYIKEEARPALHQRYRIAVQKLFAGASVENARAIAQPSPVAAAPQPVQTATPVLEKTGEAHPRQIKTIQALYQQLGKQEIVSTSLSYEEAAGIISRCNEELRQRKAASA